MLNKFEISLVLAITLEVEQVLQSEAHIKHRNQPTEILRQKFWLMGKKSPCEQCDDNFGDWELPDWFFDWFASYYDKNLLQHEE